MRAALRKLLGTCIGAALLAMAFGPVTASPASAATITFGVQFAASDFTTPNPPVPLVMGNFDLTLDTAQDSSGSAGLTLNFLNLALFAPVQYYYDASQDLLGVGAGNPSTLGFGADDFLLSVVNLSSANPSIGVFAYSQAVSGGSFFFADNTVLFVTQSGGVATTPIPAALPLFLSAIGGLGFFGWRRRKSAAA